MIREISVLHYKSADVLFKTSFYSKLLQMDSFLECMGLSEYLFVHLFVSFIHSVT